MPFERSQKASTAAMNQEFRPVPAETSPAAVSLGDVLALLRDGWWQIAAVTALLVGVALLYLQSADRQFESVLVVTPVAGSVGLPSGIGGLASIAGIRVPGSDADSQFEMFLEGLTTRQSAERLSQKHPDLLPRMFPDEWNSASRRWEQPVGAFPNAIRAVKSLVGMDTAYRPPDGARVEQWLKREIAIAKARDQRLTVISIESQDPQFGRSLLAALHQEGDNLLRERAVQRANDYAEYLGRKLGEVTVADYRQSLVEALAEQEKTRMMASSDLPFAADPFGPPSTPNRPSSPQPVLTLAIAIGLGLVLGVLMVIVRGRNRLFPPTSVHD